MVELTRDIPKPLIKVGGKSLLEHKIDVLPSEIDEVVLVIGYLGNKIKEYFGSNYNGRKIVYVDQMEPSGTGHALFKAMNLLGDDFISMMGDDIYGEKVLRDVASYPWAMAVSRAQSFPTTSSIETDDREFLKKVVTDGAGTLGEIDLDVGLYKMKKDIFKTPLVQVSNKKEWGLPHTFFKFWKDTNTPIKVVKADKWFKINSLEDLRNAEKKLQ